MIFTLSYHSAEDAASSQPPTRLGRYELIGQLATGGMAEIHLARLAGEAGFEKTVVVKRLLPELVASKAFVAMFLDEGKLVARLNHPNVCEVYELGRDGTEYFLVMPYLDGVPASDFIARPRDPDRIAQLRVAAGIITQACAGLHHAHELQAPDGASLGLVHRDVSPSNLFVTTAGVVKVLDFGIAKVHGGAETEAGTIKGKTQYMAPEQLLGEPLDRRCDVFALGTVLFELATHQRLFKRASDYLSARAILEEPIPRADAVDPAVPAALADVIAVALDRTRDKRYADARELAKAIEAALGAHGGVASAAQIAAALGEWHGAELSAMRTRQAKVIADARSRVEDAVTHGKQPQSHAVSRTEAARSRDDVATMPGKLVADPSRVLTTPRPVVRKRRRNSLVLALLVLGGAGAVVAVTLTRDERTDQRPDQVRDLVRGAPSGDRLAATEVVDARGTPGPLDGGIAVIEADATEQVSEAADTGRAVIDTRREPDGRRTKGRVEPGRDRATPARDRATPVRDRAKPAAEPPLAGTFSIDSSPYATIYIDGAKFGITPLVGKSLPAGKHTVRAVTRDGRSKTFTIEIQAGKLTNRGTLTSW